jgi:hypothetical protein
MVALIVFGMAGAALATRGADQPAGGGPVAIVAESSSTIETSVAETSVVKTENEPVADLTEDTAESELPITGTDLDKASAVALQFTGGGRVTGTEVGDEESLYEVEITIDDGRQIDVQLDEQFNVVGSETDGAGE